ncbi:MAG: hypothetical protein J6C08_00160 [Campylobacter sp.]|uniref:hypothetical protein n=1 Tax=Campylobacter sp. TaxID=205 RepID=UPI001B21B5EB|nr:hypothetical protein [Campylobacter sp.]MBO5062884.1 hypothetical protein [Campylobacter sp.]MBO5062913.1 hypothetical protein [Campylobacter sp.]
MERNFANEVEDLGREKIKELVVATYTLESLTDWFNQYGEELKLNDYRETKDFLREIIDYMLNELYLLDLAQSVIDLYNDDL